MSELSSPEINEMNSERQIETNKNSNELLSRKSSHRKLSNKSSSLGRSFSNNSMTKELSQENKQKNTNLYFFKNKYKILRRNQAKKMWIFFQRWHWALRVAYSDMPR